MDEGHEAIRAEVGRQAVEYLPALYRLALWMTKNPTEAQDLVQETYLRALRFSHRFEMGTNLKAWLFKILRNIFIDAYWKKSREPTVDLDEIAPVYPAEGSERVPAQVLVRGDLSAALEKLPDPFRTAVILSDVEGLSVAEIAEIMECPEGTVKTRLFRGRRVLRGFLQDYAPRVKSEE